MKQSSFFQNRLIVLESLRGLAAFYVFLTHFNHFCLEHRYRWFNHLFIFGQAAVILFFVISGFVIYYSSFARDADLNFRDYFVRRFRRIYPLYLLALLATYALACLGAGGLAEFNPTEFLGNACMLQDRSKQGNWILPYLGNNPLWSLSYEWWFYMMFFPTHVCLRRHVALQKYAVLGLSLIAAAIYFGIVANQISLFVMYYVIWFAGVELAREYCDTGIITWTRQAIPILCVALITGIWTIPVLMQENINFASAAHPVLEWRHFMSGLIIILSGITWYKMKFRGFNLLLGWAKYLAPVSYSLYILHFPFLKYLGPQLPDIPMLRFVVMFTLIITVCYVLEVKLQPKINRFSKRFMTKKPDATQEPQQVGSAGTSTS